MTRQRVATAMIALAGILAACSPTAQSPAASAPLPSASGSGAPVASPSDGVAAVSPSPSPTPLAPPRAPKGVTLKEKSRDPGNVGYPTRITLTIRWTSPTDGATEIRVFGVQDCMPPAGRDPAPCLVKGTPLPPKSRDLIVKAPAADGKVSWTWPAWENIGGNVAADGDTTYASIVVAAYNAAGRSRFVIVSTGQFCSDCTY